LYAVDAKTGIAAWTFKAGEKLYHGPTIGTGAAYLGSPDGHVYAVDLKTGKEIWRFKTGGGCL